MTPVEVTIFGSKDAIVRKTRDRHYWTPNVGGSKYDKVVVRLEAGRELVVIRAAVTTRISLKLDRSKAPSGEEQVCVSHSCLNPNIRLVKGALPKPLFCRSICLTSDLLPDAGGTLGDESRFTIKKAGW